MLDFDGTLVNLRHRPSQVRMSKRAKMILARLFAIQIHRVAIVSGRELKSLKTLVGVNGIRYVGSHGAEQDGKSIVLSKASRKDLGREHRDVYSELQNLTGIWIEGKRVGFAVHYRGAHPAHVVSADHTLCRILAPMRDTLRVLNGDKVWEVIPRELSGKGRAARALLGQMPAGTVAMYFGDDATDEEAFEALAGQITVKVGFSRDTHAAYCVRNPAEVLRILHLLETDLR